MIKPLKSKRIFRFKQFEMSNSHSGLKIGTDGVLLGAWCRVGNARSVWDVGSGTGLIALMLAQRCDAEITAIEIDPVSAQECRGNIANSPWSSRVALIEGDCCLLADRLPEPDLIVCNPPYFEAHASLEARDKSRDTARRSDTLSALSIIRLAAEVLSSEGALCLIAPFQHNDSIEYETALARLHVRETVDVIMRAGRQPSRRLWRIERKGGKSVNTTLCLRDEQGEFTEAYRRLTCEYYLDF